MKFSYSYCKCAMYIAVTDLLTIFQIMKALRFSMYSYMERTASCLQLYYFENFGGITEAWKQVLVQVQLPVCGMISACWPALLWGIIGLGYCGIGGTDNGSYRNRQLSHCLDTLQQNWPVIRMVNWWQNSHLRCWRETGLSAAQFIFCKLLRLLFELLCCMCIQLMISELKLY